MFDNYSSCDVGAVDYWVVIGRCVLFYGSTGSVGFVQPVITCTHFVQPGITCTHFVPPGIVIAYPIGTLSTSLTGSFVFVWWSCRDELARHIWVNIN